MNQVEFICRQETPLPLISRIDEPVTCSYVILVLWSGACSSDAQLLKAHEDTAAAVTAAPVEAGTLAAAASGTAEANARVLEAASASKATDAIHDTTIAEKAAKAAAHVASAKMRAAETAAADTQEPLATAGDADAAAPGGIDHANG